MRSLQPPNILWIHWRVYNFIANTSKGGTLLPPSDAYVRSFLYLLYTLIKLYYTHTHTHKKEFFPSIRLIFCIYSLLVYSEDMILLLFSYSVLPMSNIFSFLFHKHILI